MLRLISNFERPEGRIIWTVLVSSAFTSLGLLESEPVTFLIVLIITGVIILFVESQLAAYRINGTKLLHHRLEPEITLKLKEFSKAFSISHEPQIVIMRKDGVTWHPSFSLNSKKGKDEVSLKRGAVWMNWENRLAQKGNLQTKKYPLAISVSEQHINELGQNGACFNDVSWVLFSPIFQPQRDKFKENLIGVVLIYGSDGKRHANLLNQDTTLLETTHKFSEDVARLMCYDYLCRSI